MNPQKIAMRREDMAHRISGLSPQLAERPMVRVPLRRVHVADRNGVDLVAVFAAEREAEPFGPAVLRVAEEDGVRVREGVASDHLGGRYLSRPFEDSEVLVINLVEVIAPESGCEESWGVGKLARYSEDTDH